MATDDGLNLQRFADWLTRRGDPWSWSASGFGLIAGDWRISGFDGAVIVEHRHTGDGDRTYREVFADIDALARWWESGRPGADPFPARRHPWIYLDVAGAALHCARCGAHAFVIDPIGAPEYGSDPIPTGVRGLLDLVGAFKRRHAACEGRAAGEAEGGPKLWL